VEKTNANMSVRTGYWPDTGHVYAVVPGEETEVACYSYYVLFMVRNIFSIIEKPEIRSEMA
jgi:hypothetical protein